MMSSNLNASDAYTAVIRWRGMDPTVELETRHPGFHTPEEAALYANALTPDSPLALRLLDDGTPSLLVSDGQYVPLPASDVSVWVLAGAASDPNDVLVANDSDFEPHRFADSRFPPPPHGDYAQAQYGVLDQQGWPVDVLVDWNEADHLRVTVAAEEARDETDPALALGALPEA